MAEAGRNAIFKPHGPQKRDRQEQGGRIVRRLRPPLVSIPGGGAAWEHWGNALSIYGPTVMPACGGSSITARSGERHFVPSVL